MDERSQFTFYGSFYNSAKRIRSKAARCDFYDAICEYALNGIAPDLDRLSDAAAVGFIGAKPNLDASRRKAENGKQGGKKGKQTENKPEASEEQTESKPEASGKQTESKPEANGKQTPSEKEKEKEIEIEIEKEIEIEIENECYYIGAASPGVIALPLNDGREFSVTEAMVSEFSGLYPAVDVMQELRNMRGWLINNPKNRKTRAGIRRFINSWLSREQDRPGKTRPAKATVPYGATGELGEAEMEAIRRVLREDTV